MPRLKKEFYWSVPLVVCPKADMPSKPNMMMAAEVLVLILMESLTLTLSGRGVSNASLRSAAWPR